MLNRMASDDPEDPGVNRVLAAAASHGLPVNLLCCGTARPGRRAGRAPPEHQLVIDHLGLQQPFEPPPPAQPWADLPKVLALAQYDNVAIKITGAGTLSREKFPYPDIWDPLGRIFDAFGLERCLWGTDWTRAVRAACPRAGGRGLPRRRTPVGQRSRHADGRGARARAAAAAARARARAGTARGGGTNNHGVRLTS